MSDSKHQIYPLAPLKLSGYKSHWQMPNVTSLAWVLAQFILDNQKLIVIHCDHVQTAQQFQKLVQFFLDGQEIWVDIFPEWETLPYDQFSPHQDIISARLAMLKQLKSRTHGLLLVPNSSLIQTLVPESYIAKYTLSLKKSQQLNPQSFAQSLEKGAYQRVSTVVEHGEFVIRGSIIDLFPMGAKQPIRIDLFDDEIETIRTFDPETQLSTGEIEAIELLPAREVDLTQTGITQFKQQFRLRFGDDKVDTQLYQNLLNGQVEGGLEYYLPLFHDSVATLFDYLPADFLFIELNDLESNVDKIWHDYQERYDIGRHNPDYPLLEVHELLISKERLFTELKQHHRIRISYEDKALKGALHFKSAPVPDLKVQNNSDYPLAKFKAFIDADTTPWIICAESAGRRESLIKLFKANGLSLKSVDSWQAAQDCQQPCIIIAPLEESIRTDSLNLIAEAQILGQTVQQRRQRQRKHEDFDSAIANLIELEIGSPIVHIEHGVGRYLGLETIELQGELKEFLKIAYAGEDKLYVPVSSLHLVSRYTGATPESAPLHKLGTDKWDKAKQKAAQKAHDVAAELLDIYAQREARKGLAFNTEDEAYIRFANSFPFEETFDQEKAIEQVLADMHSIKPMDRLICGDVGFGKTEVAMRAAFVAAFNGKQVAILVPTTLLAQQHFENFRDRFADWPMNIGILSRFQSASEQKQTLQALEEGKIDIVIGTHKLIRKEVAYKDLGLIIIDEEHRFGVRQKEQLKKVRAEVDVLTMTATPIPRTLNMAMNDLRDLSIIATAPAKRQPVQTFVQEWNSDVVREACLREIRRGGQVYLLFNQVDRIERMAEDMQALLPEARVTFAHGQMNEKQLENVMEDFYHRRFNILVCTTIIETGIDIPTANTILIHRADKFGLAQLHQLRGRVGRSHHKAFAYLFTAGKETLTSDAEKRLSAIAKHNTLGAGFMLASHDLEIRGAGELLGEGQSGQIQEIGFTLYSEILERAVKALKSGKQPELNLNLSLGCEVDLSETALIPEDYLPDVHSRLVLYKRLAGAKTKEQLRELEIEMIDRFGLLPDAAKNLITTTEAKLIVEPLNFLKVDATEDYLRIQFGKSPNIEPLKLIQLVQSQAKKFQLKGQTELLFYNEMPTIDQRKQAIQTICDAIRAD